MRSRRPIGAGLVAGLVVAALQVFGALEPFELAVYDRLFEWRGPRPPRAPIVIVAIDGLSLAEFVEWPFPRALQAEVVSRVAEGKPLAIGVDIIFSLPSRLGSADDEALGVAVARAGNVVLGAAPGRTGVPAVPVSVIRQRAAAVAPANLLKDDGDSHVRRAALRMALGGQPELSFAASLHQMAAQAGLPVKSLPNVNEFLINFRGGPRTFKWMPYYQVARGEIPSSTFRNAVVLIGATTSVLHDMFPTAFARGGDMPGVEIHANALETLIVGNRIREVPRAVTAVASLVCALLVGSLVAWLPGRAVVGAGALFVIPWGVTYAAFTHLDIWTPVAGPSVAIVLTVILALVASTSRRIDEVTTP